MLDEFELALNNYFDWLNEFSDMTEKSDISESSDLDIIFENDKNVTFKTENTSDSNSESDSSTLQQENNKIFDHSLIQNINHRHHAISLNKKEFDFNKIPKVKQNVLNQVVQFAQTQYKCQRNLSYPILTAVNDYFDHCFDFLNHTYKQFHFNPFVIPNTMHSTSDNFISSIYEVIIETPDFAKIKNYYSISLTNKTERDNYSVVHKLENVRDRLTKILIIALNEYSNLIYCIPKYPIRSILSLKYLEEEVYLEGILGLFTLYNPTNFLHEIYLLFNDSYFIEILSTIQHDWRAQFMNEEYITFLHVLFLHVLTEIVLHPLFQITLRTQIYTILTNFNTELLLSKEHFLHKVFSEQKSDIVNAFHSLIIIFTKHMFTLDVMLPTFERSLEKLDDKTKELLTVLS